MRASLKLFRWGRKCGLTGGTLKSLIAFLKSDGKEVMKAIESGNLQSPEAVARNARKMCALMGGKDVSSDKVTVWGGNFYYSGVDLAFNVRQILCNPAYMCASSPIDCSVARLAYTDFNIKWDEQHTPPGASQPQFKDPLHHALDA